MATIERVTFVGVAGVEGMSPIALGPGSYVLGRSDGNDIVMKKNDISRQHARIEVAASGVTVTDLGSANGTKLNGQRLAAPATLAEGDEVQFGDRRFRVELSLKQETAPMPLASESGSLEATAIWKPPAQLASIIDRPAEATAAWIPNAAPAPAPPPPPLPALPAKPAPIPPKPKVAASAPPTSDRPAKRRSMVPVLLLLILVAGAGVGAIVLLPGLQGKGPATPTAGPTQVVVVPDEGPPKVREAELQKLSRPDRILYSRAAYFYQIRNFVGARDVIRPLAAKYPGNQAVKRKHDQVEASIKNELHRQLQYAMESSRFLKYTEALEAYRAVLRLAEPGSKERAEAEKQVRTLEAQLRAPQLE